MKLTFSEHLRFIGEKLSPDLLGVAERAELLAQCSQYPYNIATDFGFESRLGEPTAVCDFFLLIRKISEGATAISGENQIASLSDHLKNHPFWLRLSVLFREWNHPESFLHHHIHAFWLEFDFRNGKYNELPNIFFQVREDLSEEECGRWNVQTEKALEEIYQLLFGIHFPMKLTNIMRQCVEALPPGAILYQTGFMVPRKTEAIRLVLSRISPVELPGFLIRAGWQGDFDKLHKILVKYGIRFSYALFDLDIGETLMPGIGIELFFQNNKQPQWEPGWNKVFDQLGSDRLLLKEKRSGLLDFCGKICKTGMIPATYYNGINHLKIVLKPDHDPECKGYFGTMIIQNGERR